MTNIANTIYMAIVAHTKWKKRLQEAVQNGDVGAEFNEEQCELSKWLKEHGEELSYHEHYNRFVALHDKLHQQAETIIQLVHDEQLEQAKAAVDYGSEFEHLSQELVQHIIAWHDTIIGKNQEF
ncbi:MAG: CZB domain-containing protein [Pseudomonadota bacterium]|nr:CZB domain-containing protein [Pseudomonadota bacterium]